MLPERAGWAGWTACGGPSGTCAGRSGRRAGPAYLALVDAEAARTGLPADAGRALARTSRFRTPARSRSTWAAGSPHAGWVSAAPGPASRRAAVRVHAALDEHGAAVPWLVFGHTHRAGHHVIAGTSACYLNTGTWTDDVRGTRAGPRRRPAVPLRARRRHREDGAVATQAALHYWSAPQGGRGRPRRPEEPARRG